ncbi:dATP pyrophosphohydrolase [Candidatus Poribacteria bacterium]|nr:dATP pyrophosphohydrolase [Candidatus Poribacteria bacterium]
MRSAAIVVLERPDGSIAMQHRDDKPGLFGRNQWGLFGGGIEAGETPAEAAVREIAEELGIALRPDALRPLKTTRKAGGAYRHYFAYTVTDDFHGAVLMEGQDWRVMTPAEIENADVLEPHLELLRWYWPQPRT